MNKYLLLLTLLLSTSASAQQTNVLEIYKHFTLMSAAVDKCLKPSQEQLDIFKENYEHVSSLALEELKRRKSDITDEQVNNVLQSGTETLTLAVTDVVDKEGCKADQIQDLLKSFKMQVDWELVSPH